MAIITWLHISDLHFRASQAYDANIVLKALLRDIEECIEEDGLQPGFIAVTGDIAFSGRAEEYQLARQFFEDLLQVTDLGKDRLLLVPGNHDVDRGAISFAAEATGEKLTNRHSVARVLTNSRDRQLIFERFAGYAIFINDYLGEHSLFDDEHYFYVRTLRLAGQQVSLLCLNSAWLAASDQDRNRLILGERQVRAALEEAKSADLRLALMHHPFDWLQDFDREQVEPLLCGGCDFVLCGHLHRSGILSLKDPDVEAMTIAAGACYETREHPNSYNFVQLDLVEAHGSIYLRQYSDARGGFWTTDTLTYKNVSDGVYHFSLQPKPGDLVSSADYSTVQGSSLPRIPHLAPSLPLHFVPRDAELEELRALLLGKEREVAVTALRGMGGIGKTTLAIAICHDRQVLKAFPDGTLWATLGPEADVLSWQVAWGHALGDDLSSLPTAEARAARLRSLLYFKRCLLVIDDVWDAAHLSPMQVGGPECATLVTTRERKIAQKIGRELDLDVLAVCRRSLASF